MEAWASGCLCGVSKSRKGEDKLVESTFGGQSRFLELRGVRKAMGQFVLEARMILLLAGR